jgi:hypothetical protein
VLSKLVTNPELKLGAKADDSLDTGGKELCNDTEKLGFTVRMTTEDGIFTPPEVFRVTDKFGSTDDTMDGNFDTIFVPPEEIDKLGVVVIPTSEDVCGGLLTPSEGLWITGKLGTTVGIATEDKRVGMFAPPEVFEVTDKPGLTGGTIDKNCDGRCAVPGAICVIDKLGTTDCTRDDSRELMTGTTEIGKGIDKLGTTDCTTDDSRELTTGTKEFGKDTGTLE